MWWVLGIIASFVITKILSENWENTKRFVLSNIENFLVWNEKRKRKNRKIKTDRKVKRGIDPKNIKNPYTFKDHKIDNPYCRCPKCLMSMEDWELENIGCFDILKGKENED